MRFRAKRENAAEINRAFSREACPALDAGWVPVREQKMRRKLEPFAGVGVADRGREEGEAEDHHENVQHEMLLCGVSVRESSSLPRRVVEVPPAA
jgi:hypothetical protein